MTRWLVAGWLLVLQLWALPSSEASPYRVSDHVRFWRLSNGFQVIYLGRSGAPFFSAVIYVDAGSVDEELGQSGIAHLLEHMAFKGTPWIGTRDWNAERDKLIQIETVAHELAAARPDRNASQTATLLRRFHELQEQARRYVVPNEYDRLVTLAGGQDVNATTSNDYTNYFMTLPANKFEMWALLESQRLAYPAWREFYKERDVVAEERRMRMEDDPAGRLYEEFMATAFKAHPYRTPVIGWMSDIQSLTVAATDRFYRRWYVPENMVAVVVGNVDENVVRENIEKYFGTLPASPSPERKRLTEPVQRAQRRVTVYAKAQPQVVMGWHKPRLPHADAFAFELLEYILTDSGRSSRLYSELVKKRGLCESVSSFTAPGEKYPNLFAIWATPRAPHTAAEIEAAVWDEIRRLAAEPITTQELEMARNKLDAALVRELENNLTCARRLGYYYLVTKDPAFVDRYREGVVAVSPEALQRVVTAYLTVANSTVALLEPRSDSSEEAKSRQDKPMGRTSRSARDAHPAKNKEGVRK